MEIRNEKEKMEQRQWRKLRIRFPVIMIWCWWMWYEKSQSILEKSRRNLVVRESSSVCNI